MRKVKIKGVCSKELELAQREVLASAFSLLRWGYLRVLDHTE